MKKKLIKSTVKPRYSAFQETGQNSALNRGFHYCQHVNIYEITARVKNFYTLLAEFVLKANALQRGFTGTQNFGSNWYE